MRIVSWIGGFLRGFALGFGLGATGGIVILKLFEGTIRRWLGLP